MKRKKVRYYIGGSIISLFFLVPFFWTVIQSFKDNMGIFGDPFGMPEAWDFSLYLETFQSGNLGRLLLNSVIITSISVFVALFIIYMSSYAIARLVQRGKKINNLFYFLFISALSIPVFVLLMTLYKLVYSTGNVIPFLGLNKLYGLFFPYVTIQIPFLTLVLVGGLKTVPLALEEAAIMDGCKLFGVMFRIVLPTIKPIFATAFILTFLGVWNEFPIASILLRSSSQYTVPLAMAFFKGNSSDYGAMLRSAVILLIPQIIFYLIFQKRIIEGMATAGIKG